MESRRNFHGKVREYPCSNIYVYEFVVLVFAGRVGFRVKSEHEQIQIRTVDLFKHSCQAFILDSP